MTVNEVLFPEASVFSLKSRGQDCSSQGGLHLAASCRSRLFDDVNIAS